MCVCVHEQCTVHIIFTRLLHFMYMMKLFYDRVNPEGITNFAGWARMALPITTFSIVEVRICTHNTTHDFHCITLIEYEHVRTVFTALYIMCMLSMYVQVGKPNVGENRPSRVKADITIELTVNDTVKREWEGINLLLEWTYI